MTTGGPSNDRPSKNRRRDAARDKAKQLRVEQKKKDRRNKIFLQGGVGIVALGIVVVVALVIMNSIRPAVPGPANMASDGILLGEGLTAVTTSALQPDATPVASKPDATGTVANIRVYVDYLCPFCGEFETTNSEQIAKWVTSGAATVEIHPIAILTGRSAGSQYSLRAANAAACVANYSPDDFYAFNAALFVDQPEENTVGRSDAELQDVVKASGVTTSLSQINTCITDETYKSWVIAATDRATAGPIPNSTLPAIESTPTVLVDGKKYQGSIQDPKEFAAFVLQSVGASYSTSTPTPTTPAG
ncbi:thioredoxin domain-containing protein [Cryobacterium sp. CG_9.6]|uniref:DsbA family protein n=1 Tax=Cryobacterium sp. CG_9.6 TaxID=2760710 RepID=UPI0024739489|nr:thioredoxin domain-containing protein [Cryobacterium sp. CG_9.6]MDH6237854.1 protein-disulfide isomerase [Cryobacterium sp. CG_9.6]